MISIQEKVDFRKDEGPKELQEIQKEWAVKAHDFGDKGTCVLGAGFEFNYQGRSYHMKENSNFQGSLSWESCKDEIEALLVGAGAEDIRYLWGRMD